MTKWFIGAAVAATATVTGTIAARFIYAYIEAVGEAIMSVDPPLDDCCD